MAWTKSGQSVGHRPVRTPPVPKRGRKSHVETMENLAATFDTSTPEDIKATIVDWERDSEAEDKDITEQ